MANISEIARLAGVSVTTVSRVLNNYKYVSETKRSKVQKVIEELNYTPNKNAIDLIRGETKMIGVIIPYNNNQAFDQMLHGILNQSTIYNYSVTVLPTKYDNKKEMEYLTMLKNKFLDSLIITSRSNDWEKIVPYTKYGSIISCEYTTAEEVGCAYIDRYASYVDTFQMLKKKGYTNIAITTARANESLSTRQTIQAYHKVIGKLPPHLHISGCYRLEDGYRAAHEFLQLNDRPHAIYANGDEVAGGIYNYAQSVGVKIPDELAIVGQENQPIGIALDLSTVNHRLMKVGEQAFQLAIQKSQAKVNVPYEIIQRSSI
ncbi:LacI family DNA-binding transcriptional regulator [Virgibacillus salexigens]|uniref:LacI family DNA-binding transcriptional regulator n=1 Tax=Virgibacillus salexigens TaxID=61016 RepID=UPI00190A4114|nr:LacI family DNA-binding transcriptional regulator [Virgibacillus salexigens]